MNNREILLERTKEELVDLIEKYQAELTKYTQSKVIEFIVEDETLTIN